jgi:hypothetical protein
MGLTIDQIFKKATEVENLEVQMCIRDLFFLGCYLYNKGEKEAGSKACRTVLQALELDSSGISAKLETDCLNFAKRINAHSELMKLLPEMRT